MPWESLSLSASRERFDEWTRHRVIHAQGGRPDLAQLREVLVNGMPTYTLGEGARPAFTYDLEAGLTLRWLLQNLGFGVRNAADDGFWRHLSLEIIPDVVAQRWPNQPADRYWSKRSRIWLRAIWWFVHLTWQGDEQSTLAAVHGMTTDEVVGLVERPGRHGFRLELTRAISKAIGPELDAGRATNKTFRRMMKLNTARIVMVEPDLHVEGVDGYAHQLLDQVRTLRND